MMKKWSCALRIVILSVVLSLLVGIGVAWAESNTGIDLVILLDSSKSMEGYKGSTANDANYQRCDAAVMMINMCDAQQSRVAVVPFTDDIVSGSMYNEMLDIHDLGTREALCDSVLECKATSTTRGGSETMYSFALNEAYTLLSERRSEGSQNTPVVLLLSDGKGVDGEASREIADQLKDDLGTIIYCVYLNPSAASDLNELMLDLAGTADSSASEAREKYYRHGQSSDMTAFFSDIFADLIGSHRDQRTVEIEGDMCTIPVDIPNASIFETNLVFRTDLIKRGSEVEIFEPDSDEPISSSDTDMVYSYEYRDGRVSSYDYYSVKLMNHPKPGEWRIRFEKDDDVEEGTVVNYDVLYNYEIQLTGQIDRDEVRFNDALNITANFVDPNGMPSTDAALYRDKDGAPAIPAVLTVVKDGSTVLEEQMNNNQAECRYEYTINMEDMRRIWGYGDYTVRIHAEGDTLYRDLLEELHFSVVNTEPQVANPDARIEENNTVDNCFGEDGLSEPIDLSDMFYDDDGDVLKYDCEIVSGQEFLRSVEIDNGTLLNAVPCSGVSGEAEVQVSVTDEAGAKAYRSIFVRVESVRRLIEQEHAVTSSLAIDDADSKICKGGYAKIYLHYEIAEIAVGFFTEEDVNRVAEVSFTANNEPLQIQTDPETGAKFCVCNFGTREGNYDIRAEVLIDGVSIEGTGEDIRVENNAPEVVADAGTFDLSTDIDNENLMKYDLTQVFADADLAVPGSEQLRYTIKEIRRTGDGPSWQRPAFVPLRLIGLKQKPGNEFETVADDELSPNKEIQLNDIGSYEVRFTAMDADGESAEYRATVTATSKKQMLMCLAVYGIALLILIIIIAILINRFVIHQSWPRKGQPGSQMTGYRNGIQQPVNGQNVWSVNISGRKPLPLSSLYRFGNRSTDPDYQPIARELAKFKVWPTTGRRFVVERCCKQNEMGHITTIVVDGKDLLKAKKTKWRIGTQLKIGLKLDNGHVIELLWKRS